jgi:hypothetical protein
MFAQIAERVQMYALLKQFTRHNSTIFLKKMLPWDKAAFFLGLIVFEQLKPVSVKNPVSEMCQPVSQGDLS